MGDLKQPLMQLLNLLWPNTAKVSHRESIFFGDNLFALLVTPLEKVKP